ncbi:hypothetical protein TRFO_19280 [Tritrichomonas foetus]|uniref:Uncharacterized protein n=1 Tax=Tritrichomonas foetus TaxID=1144522 RepID=A0A1J4KNN0_9EUKA|nr:hypothetical protein TRFO_19280 [Tritrichomonas foetus]|eukprot:OHT11302.1 hypothetical protein TRFO_19280 [Tritrichomonas foetus]
MVKCVFQIRFIILEMSDDLKEELENIIMGDAEEYANEAYEYMDKKKKIEFTLIYYFCVIILFIIIFFLPTQNIIQGKRISIGKNLTELVLQFSYQMKSRYHPFIQLSLENPNTKGRPTILTLKYRSEIMNDDNIVFQTDYPLKSIRLFPGTSDVLFKANDIDATRFSIEGIASLVEGSFESLFVVWRHFDTNFLLFLCIINLFLCLSLAITAFLLFRKISLFQTKTPTISSKYQIYILVISVFSLFPFPEIAYFDIFYFFRRFTWFFQAFYKSLFVWFFNTQCWNLKYREEEVERKFYTKSLFIFLIIFVFLITPEIVNIKDKKFEKEIKFYFPLFIMALIILNELRLPFYLINQSYEFDASLLHLAVVFPAIASMTVSYYQMTPRFGEIEIFTKMISTLSLIFVVFIRWPFEDSVVTAGNNDIQYDAIGTNEDDDLKNLRFSADNSSN